MENTSGQEKYYLGLDMGTSSVGWAVTDDQYEIIKKHGKALWESVFVSRQIQQKGGEHFEQPEGEPNEGKTELRCFRNYFQRRLRR